MSTITNEPAVLSTESIHVTIETEPKTKDGIENGNKQSKAGNKSITPPESKTPVMRNVELTTERITQGFGMKN